MAKHRYSIDEFNSDNIIVTHTKKQMVDKKISLLHDFGFIEYESDIVPLVEGVLNKCNTENEMSVVLHDVVTYRETLTDMLKRKGVLQCNIQ